MSLCRRCARDSSQRWGAGGVHHRDPPGVRRHGAGPAVSRDGAPAGVSLAGHTIHDSPTPYLSSLSLPLSPLPLLVGREADVTQLHAWLAQARRGVRQVGFVTGEAGIGKTTVVDAFVAQLAGAPDLWLARGQCIEPYGVGEAYLPVLDALGQLYGPDGERLVAWLARHAPTWLVQMPSLLSAAALEAVQRRLQGATRERMLRELAEALEALTVERPLVLVLEDLHWSDATMDLVGALARRRGWRGCSCWGHIGRSE